MKHLLLILALLALACNSQRKVPESEPTSSLPIPTAPDIKASGNEPSWRLEIEEGVSMRFKCYVGDRFEMLVPVPPAENDPETKARIFDSETEDEKLTISIFREPCMDVMSGKSFKYTVKVLARPKGATQDYTFEGCGTYVGDYRLNDKWVLKEFNGSAIKAEAFNRVPALEFDVTKNAVSGNGGCNQISGGIDLDGQMMTFKPLMRTKMACPKVMGFEGKFITALTGNSFEYKLQGLLLFLVNEENQLVFQKEG